jgi:hypothetical protein
MRCACVPDVSISEKKTGRRSTRGSAQRRLRPSARWRPRGTAPGGRSTIGRSPAGRSTLGSTYGTPSVKHDTRVRWSVEQGNARTRVKELPGITCTMPWRAKTCVSFHCFSSVLRVWCTILRASVVNKSNGTTRTTRARVCETYMMTDLPPSLPSSVSIRFLPADADKLRISFISGNKICSTGSQLMTRTCHAVCVCVCGGACAVVRVRWCVCGGACAVVRVRYLSDDGRPDVVLEEGAMGGEGLEERLDRAVPDLRPRVNAKLLQLVVRRQPQPSNTTHTHDTQPHTRTTRHEAHACKYRPWSGGPVTRWRERSYLLDVVESISQEPKISSASFSTASLLFLVKS